MRKLLLFACLLISSPVFATTYYVNKAGSNANSCGTATSATDASAKLTIAAGLGCLSAGDTLLIGDGVYVESIRNTSTALIPSGSSGAPTTVKAENNRLAILRPTGSNYVFSFESTGTNQYITIDGLVMDAANVADEYSPVYISKDPGGSAHNIIMQNGSSINNTTPPGNFGKSGFVLGFHGNETNHYSNQVLNWESANNTGPGFYVIGRNNTFDNVYAHDNDGAGFQLYASGLAGVDNNILRNSRITNNTNDGSGSAGAVFISSGTGNLIYNNVISGNTVTGDGIYFYAGAVNTGIYFNTISGNSGTCIVISSGSGAINRNNICYSNGSDTISNSGTSTASDHNLLGTNPLFSSPTDFHLLPTSPALPPCGVLVASVTTDKDGITRPNPPSCGAYEVPSGSNPGDPLSETFESYALGESIDGKNGGTGWTQIWQLSNGTATIENTSCGLTGKALRTTATVFTEARRFFTSKTGSFTVQSKVCIDTTSANDLVGFSLIDQAGGYQIAVWFSGVGNLLLYDNGTTTGTLATFAANTSYQVRANFDTVNQPGKVRFSINDVPYGSWIDTVGSFSSISGLYVNNYATNAHTFELDDISDDGGPPVLPPSPVTPVGIRVRARTR